MNRYDGKSENDFNFPKISIIMPALNEAHHLDSIFNAIECLNYPKEKIEIILVDNGSRDGTAFIAKRRGAIVLEAPYVKIGKLRNLGVERSTGDVLAFLDSDCIVHPQWLRNALNHLIQDEVGAAGCHTRIPDRATWVEKTLDFHAHKEGVREVEYLPSANFIMKRDVFEKVGGFNPDLETGEDSDICHRIRALNIKLISDPRIHVVHLNYPKTLKQLFRKEKWHARELLYLLKSTNFRLEYLLGIGAPAGFAACIILAVWLLGKAILSFNISFLFCGIFSFFLVPAMLSFYKIITKGKVKYFFHSIIYFTVILSARIVLGLKMMRAWIRSLLGKSEEVR